jgi:DNA polymerase (family 10)
LFPPLTHDLALRIEEPAKTGKCVEFDKLKEQVPQIALDLLKIPTIGPRRAKALIAITDHSRRLKMAHGLDAKRLREQIHRIDVINAKGAGVKILKGIEVDILEDGSLDLPDQILEQLDIVVGAVNSKCSLSRSEQTERIVRALHHTGFTILAHPTGRLLSQREPYNVDMSRIIRAAAQRRCILELNADPDRLDPMDVYCQHVKDEGVLLSIGSDSHSTQGFTNLWFGVLQARRGWLEKQDVVNTRPLGELQKLLRATMKGPPEWDSLTVNWSCRQQSRAAQSIVQAASASRK